MFLRGSLWGALAPFGGRLRPAWGRLRPYWSHQYQSWAPGPAMHAVPVPVLRHILPMGSGTGDGPPVRPRRGSRWYDVRTCRVFAPHPGPCEGAVDLARQVWRRRLARDGLRRPAARDAKGPRRGANSARAAPSSAFAPDSRPRAGLRRLARLPEVRDACEGRVEGPEEGRKGRVGTL